MFGHERFLIDAVRHLDRNFLSVPIFVCLRGCRLKPPGWTTAPLRFKSRSQRRWVSVIDRCNNRMQPASIALIYIKEPGMLILDFEMHPTLCGSNSLGLESVVYSDQKGSRGSMVRELKDKEARFCCCEVTVLTTQPSCRLPTP